CAPRPAGRAAAPGASSVRALASRSNPSPRLLPGLDHLLELLKLQALPGHQIREIATSQCHEKPKRGCKMRWSMHFLGRNAIDEARQDKERKQRNQPCYSGQYGCFRADKRPLIRESNLCRNIPKLTTGNAGSKP